MYIPYGMGDELTQAPPCVCRPQSNAHTKAGARKELAAQLVTLRTPSKKKGRLRPGTLSRKPAHHRQTMPIQSPRNRQFLPLTPRTGLISDQLPSPPPTN